MLGDLLRWVSGGASDRALVQAQQLIAAGNRSEDAGRIAEACGLYRQAVHLAPRLAAAHLNLGIALAAAGDPQAAKRSYEAVLTLDPDHAFGNYNFANLAYTQRDSGTALTLVRRALSSKPDFAEAHVLLSSLLEEEGQIDRAVASLQEAIRLKPGYAGAHFNLGLLLHGLGRLDEAQAAVRGSLQLNPSYPDAHALLASVLWDQGAVPDSVECLRQAIALAPHRVDLRSRELFALNFDERLGADALFQKHAEFGAWLEQAIPARFAGSFSKAKEPLRRLRVGFVSGDFRIHPVALFLLPVLERRDRAAFEIFCYACDVRSDHITASIRALSDKWVDATELTSAELAQVIHADEVDIVVDLSGHSGSSRLAVYCEKPAPVQATWLGYLNTTGLSRMDYRFCDARTDPPDTARYHSEALYALPDSQWCYRSFLDIGCAPSAPCEEAGHITFGAFNAPSKISSAMCMRWAQILASVPESRLLIAGVAALAKRASMLASLEQAGIGAHRVDLEPRVDLDRYYALFGRVDIALDTYPYGGGTTTFDALWMGVPVVTALGAPPGSRSAGSILEMLGLGDWIAPSIDGYVDLAVKQAGDREGIARLRRSLRPRLAGSALMDEHRFVRNFEAALRQMWVDHCASTTITSGENA